MTFEQGKWSVVSGKRLVINTIYNIPNISSSLTFLPGKGRLDRCSLVLESETFFWPWDVIVMGTWQSLRDSLSVKRSLSLVIWLSLQLYQKVGGSQGFTINISGLGAELFLLLWFSSQLSGAIVIPAQYQPYMAAELGNCCLGKEVGAVKEVEVWPMAVGGWLNDELPIPDWAEIVTAGGGGVGGFPGAKLVLEMLLLTGEIWKKSPSVLGSPGPYKLLPGMTRARSVLRTGSWCGPWCCWRSWWAAWRSCRAGWTPGPPWGMAACRRGCRTCWGPEGCTRGRSSSGLSSGAELCG